MADENVENTEALDEGKMIDAAGGCDEETLTTLIGGTGVPPASPIISVKNHIYLYDDINVLTTRAFFTAINELAMTIIQVSTDNNLPIIPIELHVNSYGGDVSQALGMVKMIKDIQTGRLHQLNQKPIPVPVNTYIEGEADSCASLIACVGTKRYCSKYALSLIHPVRQIGGAGGKAEEIKTQGENIEMFQKIFTDIYLEHSKLTEEQFNNIIKDEKYSTPQQLLEWGLIDEILEY